MQPQQSEVKQEEKKQQEQPVVAKEQTEAAPPIKSEENQANWHAFREQQKANRKAKEEAERLAKQKSEEAEALKRALEALTNKPTHTIPNDYAADPVEESEEDRISRKVQEAIQKERQKYEAEARQREHQEFPQRLQSNFSDFNQVCNTDNLDYLEYHYPEVAAPFKYLPDGYDKWSAIYKAVKRFVPNTDSRKDQQKVEKNLSKPGSMSAPGTTQGTSAMPIARLDEQRKQDNWERMRKAMKGLS